MKKFFKHMFKTPMAVVFLLVIIFFAIPAVGAPAEVNRFAILTGIGIDPVEGSDEVELSLLTFTPVAKQTFTENYNVVISKGRSVSEALDFAGMEIGREVGLFHVRNVVINEKMLEKDIAQYLDYLSRNKTFELSTKLIVTDAKASEFLNAVKELNTSSSVKVSEMVSNNKEYIYATDSTFETYFKGQFGPTKVSLVPKILLESGGDGIDTGSAPQGGEQSSSNSTSQSEGGEEKKRFINRGETIVFKDGKKKISLDGLQMKKIHLMKGDYSVGSLVLEHVTNDIYNDSTLTFEIMGNTINYKVTFENGIPIFYINGKITVSLSEVKNKEGNLEKNIEFLGITEDLKEQIEYEFKTLIAEGIEIMRENQLDIVDVYTKIYNSKRKEFLKFLENLEDKDDYLNKIVFKVGINIFTK